VGYRGRYSLCRVEETASHILLNCSEPKRWREKFLRRKWLDIKDETVFKISVECTKITRARTA
jgi:predicted metal-binding transcription factor (methanogenesis marker protein 9)